MRSYVQLMFVCVAMTGCAFSGQAGGVAGDELRDDACRTSPATDVLTRKGDVVEDTHRRARRNCSEGVVRDSRSSDRHFVDQAGAGPGGIGEHPATHIPAAISAAIAIQRTEKRIDD